MSIRIIILLVLTLPTCRPQPDFTTKQGVSVYTNGIDGIIEANMWHALEFYAVEFPATVGLVSEDDVRNALAWVVIEWEPEPFSCGYYKGKEWVEGLCNGTQDYEHLRVVWYGTVPDTALYHEITHWVMQRESVDDPSHKYMEFWDATKFVNDRYCEFILQ